MITINCWSVNNLKFLQKREKKFFFFEIFLKFLYRLFECKKFVHFLQKEEKKSWKNRLMNVSKKVKAKQSATIND